MLLKPQENVASLLAAIAIPLALLALLLSNTQHRSRPAKAPSLAIFDLSSASAAPMPKEQVKPLPEPAPAPILPVRIASISTPLATVPTPIATAMQEGTCDLSAPVQAALRADPNVSAAMRRLPADSLSVANAVMVWDHAWVPLDRFDQDMLAHLRSTIVASVAAATPECRQASQSGPRFLTLGNVDATVVVLGSGQWRWQDLVDSAASSAPLALAGEAVPAAHGPATRGEATSFF